jgi:hypothetical protein
MIMTNDLGRMQKKAVMAQFKVLPQNFHGKTKRTTKNLIQGNRMGSFHKG